MKKGVLLLIIVGLALAGCSGRQEEPPVLQEITLSGLMYTPDGASLAVINGRTIKEGQEVAGYTVKSITPDCVILTKGGRDYRVEPAGTRSIPRADLGAAKSLGASRQSEAYSQSVADKEEDYKTQKKGEYLTLALSHERQAFGLGDFQRSLYHLQEAINNYKYALSLETDRLAKTDIEFKIQRLEDRKRVITNSLNR